MKGRLRKMKKAARVSCPGKLLGYCEGCRCSVRTSDEWRRVPGGVAHRECAEYVRRAA